MNGIVRHFSKHTTSRAFCVGFKDKAPKKVVIVETKIFTGKGVGMKRKARKTQINVFFLINIDKSVTQKTYFVWRIAHFVCLVLTDLCI